MDIIESKQIAGLGVSISGAATRTVSGAVSLDDTVPAGKSGSLTTRTNDTSGEVTAAGHGLAENDRCDLYWDGGRRYNVLVGVVAGNVVPISGGAGDNLPIATTVVVITKRHTLDADVDKDLIKALAAVLDQDGMLLFLDSGGTVILAVDLTANEVWSWLDGQSTNPITSDIASLSVTVNSTSDGTIRGGIGYDAG